MSKIEQVLCLALAFCTIGFVVVRVALAGDNDKCSMTVTERWSWQGPAVPNFLSETASCTDHGCANPGCANGPIWFANEQTTEGLKRKFLCNCPAEPDFMSQSAAARCEGIQEENTWKDPTDEDYFTFDCWNHGCATCVVIREYDPHHPDLGPEYPPTGYPDWQDFTKTESCDCQ